jgi:hypothetical protein
MLPALTPPIRPRMPWRVTAVQALPCFKLHVRFVDGTQGVVDLSKQVHAPNAGVFAALAEPTLFEQVFVEHGAVTWPEEIDLAKDALYAQVKQSKHV